MDAVLAETDDLAVCLTGVQVFTSGLDLRLMALSRHSEATGRGQGFSAAVFGRQGFIDDPTVDDATTPFLMEQGGNGGDGHVDLSLYLSPLPPAGPLRIIVAWPARGVTEAVTELPAEPFTEAASRVRTLWDPVEAEADPGPPPPPDVPPDSWFDHHRSALDWPS